MGGLDHDVIFVFVLFLKTLLLVGYQYLKTQVLTCAQSAESTRLVRHGDGRIGP